MFQFFFLQHSISVKSYYQIWIKSFEDMIPEMEMIASSSPEDFYRLLEHVQMRIHHYNQQNSQRQIE